MRTLVVVVLGLAACGGRAEGPSAYVLLDGDAREAGLRLEVGGRAMAPLLPLALRPEEEVALLTPSGRLPVALAAEELTWLHGADATLERAAITRDRLLVDGDEHAVRLLAEMLGGSAGPLPDGAYALSAPDLYERASFLDAPAGVREARPVVDEAQPHARAPMVGFAHVTMPVAAPRLAPLTAPSAPPTFVGAPPLVGAYEGGLILDLDGGFRLEGCRGPLLGRYTVREDGSVALTFADGSSREIPQLELVPLGGAE